MYIIILYINITWHDIIFIQHSTDKLDCCDVILIEHYVDLLLFLFVVFTVYTSANANNT